MAGSDGISHIQPTERLSNMGISFKRIALVNPYWDFQGSRYWSCADPHVPLELLFTQALLLQAGIEAMVIDAHMEGISHQTMAERVTAFAPDLIILTTA